MLISGRKFIVFSTILLSITANIIFFRYYQESQRILTSAHAKRLSVAKKQLIDKMISIKRGGYDETSFMLYKLTSELNLKRIIWFDISLHIIGDSAGSLKEMRLNIDPLEMVPLKELPGLFSSLPKEMEGDLVSIYAYLPPATGQPTLSLTDRDAGAVRLTMQLTTAPLVQKQLIRPLSIIFSILACIYLPIAFKVARQNKNRHFSSVGNMGSMGNGLLINTFQEVLQTQKAKEKELDSQMIEAETKMARMENYSRNILSCINTGVITFNIDRKIITLNKYAANLLRLKEGFVLGHKIEEVLAEAHPISRMINSTFNDKRFTSRDELEITVMSNNITLGINTSPLKSINDKMTGVIFLFSDLTKIKQLQEKLEANKRLSLLGEMSAGIAHEFRNIMGAIFGYSRLLSKQVAVNSPQQELVSDIIDELEIMEKLITELLNLGRETPINLSVVDIKALIVATVGDIRKNRKKAPIFVNIGRVPQKMPIDSLLFSRALTNLVLNSLDALEGKSGGMVEIHAKQMDDPDHIITSGLLLVEVRDNGCGIPLDMQKKIFLPFFTTKSKGTGLGLALTNKIIMSHGGRIELKSGSEGSMFRLFIPMDLLQQV